MLKSDIDQPQLRRAWNAIDEIFFEHGLTLKRGYDFNHIDECARKGGLNVLEAHFTPELNTYGNGRAFWLGLFANNNELIGRVCARLDHIKPPMCLTDLWRKELHRYYPSVRGGKVHLSERQPRFAQKISGKVVYLGGTIVHPDFQRFRLGGYLNQMAQIEALDEWDADFFYGWMEHCGFKEGFWRNCGFSRAQFNAIRWADGGPVPIDEDLIWAGNDRDGVLDLIERILDFRQPSSLNRRSSQNQILSETSE